MANISRSGIPPNPPGSWSDYSCPAVQMPDGECIMDSFNIAEKFESLYPEPSLHLDNVVYKKVQKALGAAVGPLRYMVLAAVQRNVLREPSASWFAEDRTQRFGKTLDQLEKDEGGETAWSAAKDGLEMLKVEMTEHKQDEGPFVLGSTVSYGDLIIAAFFTWFEKADSVLYERFVGYDETFGKHHEACRPWLARDSH